MKRIRLDEALDAIAEAIKADPNEAGQAIGRKLAPHMGGAYSLLSDLFSGLEVQVTWKPSGPKPPEPMPLQAIPMVEPLELQRLRCLESEVRGQALTEFMEGLEQKLADKSTAERIEVVHKALDDFATPYTGSRRLIYTGF